MRRADSLKNTLMLGKIEDKKRRGAVEDEVVKQCHCPNGHEFEHIPGDNRGQRSLAYCRPFGCKLDTT